MLKRLAAVFGALVFAAGLGSPFAAHAQPKNISQTVGVCDPNYPANCLKPAADGSIAVTGGGGGGGTTTPFAPTGNTSLSITSTSARVILPSADTTVLIQNLGPATTYVKFGSVTVAATTSDTPILPGQALVFNSVGSLYVAGISASSTASLTITTGSGTPVIGLSLDNSAGVPVKGSIASGVAAADAPLLEGCLGKTSTPTAVSDGQVVNGFCDAQGRRINWNYALSANAISGLTVAMTGTTSTAVTGMGAPGAGLFNYITTLVCGNSHATVGTFVELQDGSGGTTFFTIPAAPIYGGASIPLPYPLKQPTANTGLFVKDTTTGANVICSGAGFKGP